MRDPILRDTINPSVHAGVYSGLLEGRIKTAHQVLVIGCRAGVERKSRMSKKIAIYT